MKGISLDGLRPLRSVVLALSLGLAGVASAQEAPPKIKEALDRADKAVAAIVAIPRDKRTFDNTIRAIDDLNVRLSNDVSLFLFKQFVSTDAREREEARVADEVVSNWEIALGKREDLYQAVRAYADTKPALKGEDARLLEFLLRDYRRAGMDLPKEERDRLQQLEMEMNRLSIEFEKNIAQDETRVPLTAAELKGVPQRVLDRLTRAGDVYLVSMDGPTYIGVMENAENEATRQKVWMSYRRRAGTRNVEVLEDLIRLRARATSMLGYKTTVDHRVETRMAKDAETIRKFYEELRPIVRQKAELDFAEFQQAKREHTGNPEARFNPWDYGFYRNMLLRDKYAVDSSAVQEYFPLDRVLQGLFDITQSLYGLTYTDITAKADAMGWPTWHEDVKLFEVTDKESGRVLGHFFLDLHPRDNKYTHAAVWGLHQRKEWADGKVQTPLAAMVTNFTKPTADKPSLLTHDEVETFFHEFGHVLHHMVTEARHGRFSGTAVARDFVEAPSQMMENWVWIPETLDLFARHYRTGASLPRETLEAMERARTLGSGLEAEGQFYLGLLDYTYHTAPRGEVDTTEVAMRLYDEVTMYEAVPGTFFQASFGHLTGYEGAYYGYMWSNVYAQDMFERFREKGVLAPEAGRHYRDTVLARGGTLDEMEMLRAYLGREPSMEAFLHYLGLKK
jgi:thimet oligopeptidase